MKLRLANPIPSNYSEPREQPSLLGRRQAQLHSQVVKAGQNLAQLRKSLSPHHPVEEKKKCASMFLIILGLQKQKLEKHEFIL